MSKRSKPVENESTAKNAKLGTDVAWSDIVGDDGHCRLLYRVDVTLPGHTGDEINVIAFDVDGTLAVTKSGRKFGKDADDWQLFSGSVPVILQSEKDSDKPQLFVIFTNQKGVKSNKITVKDLQRKLDGIVKKIGVPMMIFASTDDDEYRKPWTGMWDFMANTVLTDRKVSLELSLYVGDAAGRSANTVLKRKKDFSCSDRKFAANIGIAFKTPEEYFMRKSPEEFSWLTHSPADMLKQLTETTIAGNENSYTKDVQELIVMVGNPGSGKSRFCEKYFSSKYNIINRDSIKNMSKCYEMTRCSLSKKQSVVIDNTNPSKTGRKEFIVLAKNAGVSVRCFVMQTSVELCRHLNHLRCYTGMAAMVPKIAYNVYKSKYDDPDENEGFAEIVKIPFVPNFTYNEREMFSRWTE